MLNVDRWMNGRTYGNLHAYVFLLKQVRQKSTLAKTFMEKTSKSAKHACHYTTKKNNVKITTYLGLDIIIKFKFTAIFDSSAILNVINYLTKNFES